MQISQQDKLRFMQKVSVSGLSDCWLWKAAKSKKKYGHFKINKK